MEDWVSIGYLISAALFIFGLKKLGHPRTAPFGNQLGAMGMLVAVITTVLEMQLTGEGVVDWTLIGAGLVLGSAIGYWMAKRVKMTGMPELVALFNGFGGAASALVALSEIQKFISDTSSVPDGLELTVTMVAAGLSALVGWMTLTGSLLAMYKLKGGVEIFGKWIKTPTWGPTWLNPVKVLLLLGVIAMIYMSIEEPTNTTYLWAIIGISCLLGIILVLPIGGADMPVVVSLLNSLSNQRTSAKPSGDSTRGSASHSAPSIRVPPEPPAHVTFAASTLALASPDEARAVSSSTALVGT